MLYTSEDQKKQENKPFDGSAVNDLGPIKVTGIQKFMYWLCIILTLGILFFVWNISKVNYLNKLQNKINESASGIEVQLEKRFSTLTKLVQAVEGHVRFNKEVYENIAKFRSGNQVNDLNSKASAVSRISSGINFAFENYPELGADESIRKLMNESTMIEKEIAAARRLYNADVTSFNSSIYNWPTNVVVVKKGYHGLNLFKAEEEHKNDVDISFNTK